MAKGFFYTVAGRDQFQGEIKDDGTLPEDIALGFGVRNL